MKMCVERLGVRHGQGQEESFSALYENIGKDEAANLSQEFITFIAFNASLHSLHRHKTPSRQHPVSASVL